MVLSYIKVTFVLMSTSESKKAYFIFSFYNSNPPREWREGVFSCCSIGYRLCWLPLVFIWEIVLGRVLFMYLIAKNSKVREQLSNFALTVCWRSKWSLDKMLRISFIQNGMVRLSSLCQATLKLHHEHY